MLVSFVNYDIHDGRQNRYKTCWETTNKTATKSNRRYSRRHLAVYNDHTPRDPKQADNTVLLNAPVHRHLHAAKALLWKCRKFSCIKIRCRPNAVISWLYTDYWLVNVEHVALSWRFPRKQRRLVSTKNGTHWMRSRIKMATWQHEHSTKTPTPRANEWRFRI